MWHNPIFDTSFATFQNPKYYVTNIICLNLIQFRPCHDHHCVHHWRPLHRTRHAGHARAPLTSTKDPESRQTRAHYTVATKGVSSYRLLQDWWMLASVAWNGRAHSILWLLIDLLVYSIHLASPYNAFLNLH